MTSVWLLWRAESILIGVYTDATTARAAAREYRSHDDAARLSLCPEPVVGTQPFLVFR